MLKDLNLRNMRNLGTAAIGLGLSGLAMAQASTVETAIESAKTEITGYIAIGGAALIAIAVLGVGWRVGAKLVKRLAGAA